VAQLPQALLRHVVTIEPKTGDGPFGPVLGPAATARVFVDDQRRMVRDANGTEVVSSSSIYAPLATVCPPGSRVTLPGGRTADVIVAKRRDGGGLATPDHLEVSLT
jgi:hypothetical protein